MPERTPHNDPARMKYTTSHRLWRVVEGAVVDAFNQHPEYLTEAGYQRAVPSVTKRVVGNLRSAFGG